MRTLQTLLVLLLILLILGVPLVYAQESENPTPTATFTPTFTLTPTWTLSPTPTPTMTPTATIPSLPPVPPYYQMGVSVTATDGLTLYGDLYLVDAALPTILLLHEMYTDRTSWNTVWPGLLAGGFNALAVDVRGHGATMGLINWDQAVVDVQTWIDWMRANNLPHVITMGSSMGSALAIVGCANDPGCLGVVAISPGWSYYEISVYPAFEFDLDYRPALLVLAHDDPWPKRGVPRMLEVASNDVTVQEYPGNAHGMMLFDGEPDLLPYIVQWLWLQTGERPT
jgi:pimeloyl-ACP methyl ester carboxylesterase